MEARLNKDFHHTRNAILLSMTAFVGLFIGASLWPNDINVTKKESSHNSTIELNGTNRKAQSELHPADADNSFDSDDEMASSNTSNALTALNDATLFNRIWTFIKKPARAVSILGLLLWSAGSGFSVASGAPVALPPQGSLDKFSAGSYNLLGQRAQPLGEKRIAITEAIPLDALTNPSPLVLELEKIWETEDDLSPILSQQNNPESVLSEYINTYDQRSENLASDIEAIDSDFASTAKAMVRQAATENNAKNEIALAEQIINKYANNSLPLAAEIQQEVASATKTKATYLEIQKKSHAEYEISAGHSKMNIFQKLILKEHQALNKMDLDNVDIMSDYIKSHPDEAKSMNVNELLDGMQVNEKATRSSHYSNIEKYSIQLRDTANEISDIKKNAGI